MRARHWLATILITAAVATATFVLTSTPPCFARSCGPIPPKPPPPAGCRMLCPQCQCDARGFNCSWVWYCCG